MNVTAFPNSIDRQMVAAVDEGISHLRAPVLKAAANVDKAETIKSRREKRIDALRLDISTNEKSITRLQKEQAIRDAELQSDLAALAQEIAEREAALKKEAEAREAAILKAIESNRCERKDEIAELSELVASSYAALNELQNADRVLDARVLGLSAAE